MKNKLLKIGAILVIAVMLLQVISMAAVEKLTLKPAADKTTYKKGETVKVSVSWEEKMESAGFDIKYDAEKLTFKQVTDSSGKKMSGNFYNGNTAGKVTFNWFAMDPEEATNKIVFEFEAKGETGDATISVENASGFGYGEPIVKVKDIDTSNVAKVSFEKIGATNQNTTNTTNTNTQKPGNTVKPENTVKPSNTVKPGTQNKVDNTIVGGKIPHTGTSTTVIFVIASVAIVGFVCYKKYQDLAGI